MMVATDPKCCAWSWTPCRRRPATTFRGAVYPAPRSWVESMIISRHPGRGFLRSWTSAMPQVSPSAGFARRSSTATTCHRLSTCVLARCPACMGSFEDRHPDGIRSPRSHMLTASGTSATSRATTDRRTVPRRQKHCDRTEQKHCDRTETEAPSVDEHVHSGQCLFEPSKPLFIPTPSGTQAASHSRATPRRGGQPVHERAIKDPKPGDSPQARESRPVLTRGRIRAGCLGSVGAGDGGVLGHRSGF